MTNKVVLQVPDDVSPHELQRLARSSNVTHQMHAFLDEVAAAIRKARSKPIVIERLNKSEWRIAGQVVRLRAWMTPCLLWALSEPGLRIHVDDGSGIESRYKQCHSALQSAQDAIARQCGDTIGRLARYVHLSKTGSDGPFITYDPPVGAPDIIGPTYAEDRIAAEIGTPRSPRRSRARAYDPFRSSA